LILIIFFVSLFSLDVRDRGCPLELLAGFLMHNMSHGRGADLCLETAYGGVCSLAAAALFAIYFVRDIYSLANLVFFVLPILLVACLFYIDWRWLEPQSPAQVDAAA
jgi:hypothetical protein